VAALLDASAFSPDFIGVRALLRLAPEERDLHTHLAKSNRRQVRQLAHPPASPGAPERAGHHDDEGLRERAIIAVVLGCALRRSQVAALADERCSGGFTPEATVAAPRANTPDWWCSAFALRPCFSGAPCGSSARRGVAGGTARPSASCWGRKQPGD
jgi:hypothetical protein